jgi:transposase
VSTSPDLTAETATELASIDAALEELSRVRKERDAVAHERDEYKKAYEIALLSLERLRRQLFGQKADKVDASQLALAFAEVEKRLQKLQEASAPADEPSAPPGGKKPKKQPASHGRRKLDELDLPEDRIEVPVHGLAEGAVRIGEDVSYRLSWRRASYVRLAIVRPRFAAPNDAERAAESGNETTVVTADAPDELLPRGMLSVDLCAKILADKFCDHLPFHRQEQRCARLGIPLDRTTMCRYADAFHQLGKLVVDAMADEARKTAHVIATDATGILVQDLERCRRGHFFVLIADRDHVFFRYTAKHNGDAVKRFLGGFSGFLQADACSVYDALYREPEGPTEVGCLAHARRNFVYSVGSDKKRALVAIAFLDKIFEVDRLAGNVPPSERLAIRKARAAPIVEELYRWVREQLATPLGQERSPIAKAFRYLINHEEALTRFLTDGRVRLDNNPSELALRSLVLGRKNWLFVGSDEHAEITATLVSLVASAKLHGLDPELYLRDLARVMPTWPKPRFLELAPKYWRATRDRLDADELAAPLGPLRIPPRVQAQTE